MKLVCYVDNDDVIITCAVKTQTCMFYFEVALPTPIIAKVSKHFFFFG